MKQTGADAAVLHNQTISTLVIKMTDSLLTASNSSNQPPKRGTTHKTKGKVMPFEGRSMAI